MALAWTQAHCQTRSKSRKHKQTHFSGNHNFTGIVHKARQFRHCKYFIYRSKLQVTQSKQSYKCEGFSVSVYAHCTNTCQGSFAPLLTCVLCQPSETVKCWCYQGQVISHPYHFTCYNILNVDSRS